MVFNCEFEREPSTPYTRPTIEVTGSGRATLIGNRAQDKAAGAGTFISITTDNYNQVRANSFPGWSSSFPLSPATGIYESDARNQYQEIRATAVNFILESGANNAIATPAGSGPRMVAGLQVQILLGHSLQAGANTFAYNGGAALPIVSHRNPANNIAAGYVVGSIISLIFNSNLWQDISQ
jgi:hypothetical protein